MPGNELVLHTTMGPRRRSELGLILPHEHVFVDLRTPDHIGHGEAAEAEVVELMVPQVQAAMDVGVTALVECSTGGGGRGADLGWGGSMRPQVQAAMAVGVTALVACSTGGVGRRADLDLAVSQATGLPIAV